MEHPNLSESKTPTEGCVYVTKGNDNYGVFEELFPDIYKSMNSFFPPEPLRESINLSFIKCS
jgi:hypothetical protein